MLSNSVCNHTRKWKKSDPRGAGNHLYVYRPNWTPLSPIRTTSSPERFSLPTSKAREKRPGDEVAIGITYKTIIAKKKQQQSNDNACCYVYASQRTWNVLKLALQSKYFGLQISNSLKKKLSVGVIDFKLA